METKNAKITSTMLGIEDHGIMSFMLYLDYGVSVQKAGGYVLDTPIKNFTRRIGTAEGMSLIMEIMKIVGVEKWEDLPGKHIRVKAERNKVHAIGNYLKDEWLDFEQFFNDITHFTKLIEE